MAVNFKNALQRVKDEKDALERIRSRSSVTYADISHPLIRPTEERSFSVHTEADFQEDPFRMSDGTLVRSIVFPNERDYGTDPLCVASDGRVFTFLDLPSMADRLGVVRHADAFLEERFRELAARRPLHFEIHRAYDAAVPTKEVVTGRYAEDFAGTVTWSRALDFARGSCESVYSGLRYMDFKDCTNVYALRASDGEAVSVDAMKSSELLKVVGDLRYTLAARAALKAGGKERMTRTLSEGGPLTRDVPDKKKHRGIGL